MIDRELRTQAANSNEAAGRTPRELFDLTGLVAIVSGSSRGLGHTIAGAFGAAGASIVVSGRSQERCEAAADSLRANACAEVMPLACDLSDWDAVPAFVDVVRDRFETVDVLVNNAGISPPATAIEEITLPYWLETIANNLQAPLRLSQCVAPAMRERGGGSIINVASAAAHGARPLTAAYAASKAGLISLTRSMAMAWAPSGIRVNSISPGPFLTELLVTAERSRPGLAAEVASSTYLNRLGDPDELIGAAIYLASRASSYVTGADIAVTGGF